MFLPQTYIHLFTTQIWTFPGFLFPKNVPAWLKSGSGSAGADTAGLSNLAHGSMFFFRNDGIIWDLWDLMSLLDRQVN